MERTVQKERRIDYDRGVMIRTDAKTGVDVFMYFDNPGIYYNAHATPVSEDLAKQAGFDTVRWAKEKVKRDRMAQAAHLIEQEMELADSQMEQKVVSEREGFKVVSIGLGRHIVKDPDDNTLTLALTKEAAMSLLKQLVPEEKQKAK